MSENKVKVSVYCMTYNHEDYIRAALDGFVNQKTNFDYEVIIHDDASTDATADIVREYEAKYPKIIKPIYQKENQYSKRTGIFKTFILPNISGDYIAVCEGDDYWNDPDKLQKQVDFLDAHPEYSSCVHNSWQINMKTGERTLINKSDKKDYDIQFQDVIKGGNTCYQSSSLIYRKEFAYDRPEFFNKAKIFSDYPLSIYLVIKGKMRFFADTMSTYRYLNQGSWTSNQMNMTAAKNADRYNYAIDMLKSVDEYTNYEHHKMIKRCIRDKEYIRDRVLAGHSVFKIKYLPIYFNKISVRIRKKGNKNAK